MKIEPWEEEDTYWLKMGDDGCVHADDSAAYIAQEHNKIVGDLVKRIQELEKENADIKEQIKDLL